MLQSIQIIIGVVKISMDYKELPRLIDISCVRTNVTMDELEKMVQLAKQYRFICCFAMPCFTPWLANALKDEKDILLGGVVGFPSGADSTKAKLYTAKELMQIGCNELDMVINVGALKSEQYKIVEDDIKAIVDAANGLPVKSILEVAYLTDYEIQKASELAVKAGVTFVKTGTGWANKPTTVNHIKLIKKAIGKSAKIKAAGGIRDVETIESMINEGCSRFGIGINSAINIMNSAFNNLTNEFTKNKKNDTY
ncbi:deoxyribose-phosphate aldolase [Paludicola sp. MB14-C6]|uniref:deoxyribose-phosphate aldolase n=1 Tax=Paludihabitans sp. MB14-C6 TaxID=3070656 RepID=UPI0027DD8391|nr:deoxyribose-phosphate aldolase [Paludicola sp. MB14-C6]WMJ22334.1 deoxyribose-phosphate aldolase [Paludicola sp. MB14-C6]